MDPVLIAGAGPVGCTLALFLAQNDIPIILVEAEKTIPMDLRASTFHPPTLDMLARLGLVKDMLTVGLKVNDYQYRDRRSNEVAKFNLSVLADETKHPYRLQCEQYKMAGIVVEKLKAFPHAEVRFGTRIKGFSELDSKVQALIQDDVGEEYVRCSYLVGCDGANSVVRQAGGMKFEGMTYPERFLVASTSYKFEEFFEDLSLVNYVSDPDEWCVLLKTSDFWRVLIPTPIEQEDSRFLTDEFIQDRLHRLADNDNDFDIIHRTLYRVHQRVASSYQIRDRVLIAGDAAHVNNPLGGMGMNGGVQDAINLAEKLVEIINHGGDRQDLLALYNRQRRGICTQFIQEHTKKNKALMEATDKNTQVKRQAKFMKSCSDPILAKAFVMETSMINCVRDSYQIT